MAPKRRSRAAHTPLFDRLRSTVRLAGLTNQPHTPPLDELIDLRRAATERRRFLKTAAAAALVSIGGGTLTGCTAPTATQATPTTLPATATPAATTPRIVIVGAGVAGLNAAYRLQQAGLLAQVYEGSTRTGGRMYSARDLLAPGLTTELGGEFIDSGHTEMLTLAQEFGLDLLDMQAAEERDLIEEAYFFGGQHYREAEVVEAFRPIAARMQADYDELGDIVNYREDGGAARLDRLSIAEYLDEVGAEGWLRDLLDVAYLTEYGLPIAQQSALNLLFLIGTDLSADEFAVFGESDERYKIVGGNQRIVDELAQRVENQIQTEHRLEAIRSRGQGYTLTFETGSGAQDVTADIVLLALPFSILRTVEIQGPLPEVKQRAIRELGYGKNAKLMLGFERRVWREQGYAGNVFSDEAFQLAWDNSRLQPGDAGGMTIYASGEPGVQLGSGAATAHRDRLLPGLERAFPGVTAAHNNKVERFHWPSFAWTQGSYSCYTTGQWTSIAGAEIEPVGNLFFAGEHCSYDFQGYMNGGADTGRQAAEAIAKLV